MSRCVREAASEPDGTARLPFLPLSYERCRAMNAADSINLGLGLKQLLCVPVAIGVTGGLVIAVVTFFVVLVRDAIRLRRPAPTRVVIGRVREFWA